MKSFVKYFGFLFICLSSCTPIGIGPYPVRPTQYIPKDFKDYADFKSGSYWVYENTANASDIDSVTITSHVQRVEGQPDGLAPCEQITDQIHSSATGNYFASTGIEPDSVYCDYTLTDATGNHSQIIYFTADHVGEVEMLFGNLEYMDFKDTLSIGNSVYKSVKEFKIIGKPVSSTILPSVYWAKNIGIIRKTTPDGKIWNLIRYHVVQ